VQGGKRQPEKKRGRGRENGEKDEEDEAREKREERREKREERREKREERREREREWGWVSCRRRAMSSVSTPPSPPRVRAS